MRETLIYCDLSGNELVEYASMVEQLYLYNASGWLFLNSQAILIVSTLLTVVIVEASLELNVASLCG